MPIRFLRGIALLIAISLPLCCCSRAQDGGQNAEIVEGVYLLKGFKTGMGGMRLPTWRPYLLLKDGTAYESPKLAPDSFDVALSRQNEASRWGTWTKQGDGVALNMPSHSSTIASDQHMQPAAAGMTLQGSYKHMGGGGDIASGGHTSFIRSDSYRFSPDGRFSSGSNSGLIASRVMGEASNGVRTGHYRIHDYSIDLRYDDGSEAHLFFYTDGKKLLHIGDADYVPAN